MKTYSFKHIALALAAALSTATLSAATIDGATMYVDFGATSTGATGFNQFSVASTGSVAFYEQSLANLEDTAGNLTGTNFLLNVDNGSRNVAGSNSGNDHNPVEGIPTNATTDGIWFNNQSMGTAGGESFGFTLTFSNLDTNYAYDIMVLMADGTTTDFTWQIATGTGDADSITVTAADAISATPTWTSVTPEEGVITITGLASGPLAGSNTGRVNLVSLTATIPEASSAMPMAIVAIAIALGIRFKRRK